jgi:hypothetical protein
MLEHHTFMSILLDYHYQSPESYLPLEIPFAL